MSTIYKKIFFFVFFGSIALFNILYTIDFIRNISTNGAVDFNTYWYSGLFIRQGISPYQGFLQNHAIELPISFISKSPTDLSYINTHPGELNVRPGNTAPFVIIMSLFSFLPLNLATRIWSIINILIAFVIPILILNYLKRTNLTIPIYFYPLSILIFFSLNMTSRGIIANGQNGLLIFLFILLSLMTADRRKLTLSGIFLGFALSKYNLVFPVFIYFIIKKEYRILITAIIVQLLGLFLLSSITVNTSPIQILQDYLTIARYHQLNLSGSSGVNISNYLPKTIIISIFSFIGTTLLIILVYFIVFKKSNPLVKYEKKMDMILISVLFLWGLLSVYHLGYDTILMIFPLLFLFLVLENDQKEICGWFYKLNLFLISVIIGILIIPGSIFRFIFSYKNASSIAMTFAIILLLIMICIYSSFFYKAKINLQ